MKLTRQESIAKLREGQARVDAGEIEQIRQNYFAATASGKTGYCGIGYVRYESDPDGSILDEQSLGLTPGEVRLVLDWNDDDRLSFAEIADKLEALPA